MSSIDICLKIKFQRKIAFIICDAASNYETIRQKAGEYFHIPTTQRSAIVLTNDQGYIFEQQVLENFLLLFPCPKIVFCMRLDWNKLRRAATEKVAAKTASPKRRREEATETQSTAVSAYAAVPVRRQNCFLGRLPDVLRDRQPDETASTSTKQQQQRQQQQETSGAAPAPKRFRLALQRQPREAAASSMCLVTAPSSYGRSIRI